MPERCASPGYDVKKQMAEFKTQLRIMKTLQDFQIQITINSEPLQLILNLSKITS
jgi:hypothetical protein